MRFERPKPPADPQSRDLLCRSAPIRTAAPSIATPLTRLVVRAAQGLDKSGRARAANKSSMIRKDFLMAMGVE
jgi:hypothetical protein